VCLETLWNRFQKQSTSRQDPPDPVPGAHRRRPARARPAQRRRPRRPTRPAPERRRYRLDLAEARAVLEAAAHIRNAARWTVALALGLRQSEALALQWKDVDLLANTLTVRRSIHRVRGGGLVYEEPKSKRSHRTLALPLPLVAELHRHEAAQLGERMLAGSECTTTTPAGRRRATAVRSAVAANCAVIARRGRSR
jgi:integrase